MHAKLASDKLTEVFLMLSVTLTTKQNLCTYTHFHCRGAAALLIKSVCLSRTVNWDSLTNLLPTRTNCIL